jgi:hypothetical protein
MVYEWKEDGERKPTLAASIVGGEIEKLTRNLGREVEAEDLVDSAQHQTSPLHGLFEWDDELAGYLYRVDQAEKILVSIVVVGAPVPVSEKIEPVTMRAEPRRDAPRIQRVDSHEAAVERARRELARFVRLYGEFDEFAPICQAISTVLSEPEELREAV